MSQSAEAEGGETIHGCVDRSPRFQRHHRSEAWLKRRRTIRSPWKRSRIRSLQNNRRLPTITVHHLSHRQRQCHASKTVYCGRQDARRTRRRWYFMAIAAAPQYALIPFINMKGKEARHGRMRTELRDVTAMIAMEVFDGLQHRHRARVRSKRVTDRIIFDKRSRTAENGTTRRARARDNGDKGAWNGPRMFHG